MVPSNIDGGERFLRTIKSPAHLKDGPVPEVKALALFKPVITPSNKSIDGEQWMDGVSIDRLAYCAPLSAKAMAVANISQSSKNIQQYVGFAVISVDDVNEINSMTIPALSLIGIKNKEQFAEKYSSSLPQVKHLLAGFDTSSLDDCQYCGIISTPMLGKARVIPASQTQANLTPGYNGAHAEIFYMLKINKPTSNTNNEPINFVMQEVARMITEKAKIYFDIDPNNLTSAPEIE